jgi:hypothetical protein
MQRSDDRREDAVVAQSDDDARRRAVGAVRAMTERPTSALLRAREMTSFRFGGQVVDVRGWPVFASDARYVGVVSALLVEVRTRRVRYLDVELPATKSGRPTGGVLVPIGLARRPDNRQVVVLTDIHASELTTAPHAPARRPVTHADELAALRAFGIGTAERQSVQELYRGPSFDPDPLFH